MHEFLDDKDLKDLLAILNRHAEYLCHRHGLDRVEAEDFVQTAIHALYESEEPVADPLSFCRVVVRRRVIDRVRKTRESALPEEVASREAPEHRLIRQDLFRRTCRALPARQYQVVQLYRQGYSTKEMAVILGTEAQSVKNLLSRARASLRAASNELEVTKRA